MLAEQDVMGHVRERHGVIIAGRGISPVSREQTMRPIALGLLMAASVSLPAFAAEPDGPANLIDQTEAVRIAVQGLLAAKAGDRMRRPQKTR